MKAALESAHEHRQTTIELAVLDRGYRGASKHVDVEVLLPNKKLKRDTPYQSQKKRILCRQRAAIEPIIGHLKHDYRLSRNWLKGSEGDSINLLMAACAWNLKKWMIFFFVYQNVDVSYPDNAPKATFIFIFENNILIFNTQSL